MVTFLVKKTRQFVRSMGFDIIKYPPLDLEKYAYEIINSIQDYTMTSPALCESVKYVVNKRIPGDIVECGVWKGGSMMAVAKTLLMLEDTSHDLWLFDTFEGMSQPTKKDISIFGSSAKKLLDDSQKTNEDSIWCYSPLEEVKERILSLGYPEKKIHFIKGMVEETIPKQSPSKIALLRLDTDWYESTYHELVHLFPRLSTGGILILDDYGYWQGARQAVDDYLQAQNVKILLNRIDDTGRIAIKI